MNDNLNAKQIPKRSIAQKWKRQKPYLRILYLLVSLIFLITLLFFTFSILKLAGIEDGLRVVALIFLYIHLLVAFVGGLWLLLNNHKKSFIAVIVLSLIYSIVMGIGSFFIDKTYNIIDNVQKKFVDYTSVMVSLKDTDEYKRIGIISAKDHPTGYIIPQSMIKEYSITGELVSYDDEISMLSDLYDGLIDALFITDGYVTMYSSYEKFAKLESETKVVHSMSKRMENVDNVTYSTKNLTEPFTILLMGVDSTGDDISSSSSFNGDSLMMITFNPKTLNTTVFSIPRDTYVPISCYGGRENKINSSAYGGASCVVSTIENLTGIKIDYYAKINFNGVVRIVDDLGGIDVDVPLSFCEQDSQRRFGEYLICLDKGEQRLSGEQALALARHRKTLPLGDFQRVQNQQLVVEAMVRELKNIKNTDDFYKILDDVANNVDTNMTTPQILSLYNVAKKVLLNSGDSTLSIERTYLTGYDLTMYMDAMRSYIYTFQYYKQSLADIVALMKSNLELESPKEIKTFSFDARENYEKRVVGKTYYNEPRRELLPNFVGYNKKEMETWATEHDITLNFKEEKSKEPDNIILSISEHPGKLVELIQSIDVSISKHDASLDEPVKPSDDNENNKDNDDEDEEKIVLPNFVGKSLQEFNNWKNSLKSANIVIDTKVLTPEDMLSLENTELTDGNIYRQSSPAGTDIKEISTLTVYYYEEPED